ncbi:KIAA2022-like protein [Platysternon megacephalum]|uniref:KIAA2022-like protein n=1 Tax=Platysternon megacephalum TaxID=55544 RepID=A0A4D9F4G3_9SAUR|nr:KIAA2022-like protein [Platysternon megacephalum]
MTPAVTTGVFNNTDARSIRHKKEASQRLSFKNPAKSLHCPADAKPGIPGQFLAVII